MSMRTCYSWGPDGFFVGESVAHADRQQPGSWLLPAFSTFFEPPSAPGKLARWVSNTWMLVDAPEPTAAPDGPSAEFLAARERQAKIEDASAAAFAISRLLNAATARGETVLQPWRDYLAAIIDIANTPSGAEPKDIPHSPTTPMVAPPQAPPAPPQEE